MHATLPATLSQAFYHGILKTWSQILNFEGRRLPPTCRPKVDFSVNGLGLLDPPMSFHTVRQRSSEHFRRRQPNLNLAKHDLKAHTAASWATHTRALEQGPGVVSWALIGQSGNCISDFKPEVFSDIITLLSDVSTTYG